VARAGRGDARRVRRRPARRPPERRAGGRTYPASPRISQFFQGIPNFSKEIPSFFQTFPSFSKEIPWRFSTKSRGWRRCRPISPFSSLAARIARWRSVLLSSLRPPARRGAGDADDAAVANRRRTSIFRLPRLLFFRKKLSRRPARAARRRGFRARWRRDRWSREFGAVDTGATRRSRAGRNGRLLRNRSELAGRVYKRRRPVAGANPVSAAIRRRSLGGENSD